MAARFSPVDNNIPKEARKRYKNKIKNSAPVPDEGKGEVSLESKLHTQPKINLLKDSSIPYNQVRRSKIQGIAADGFKLVVQAQVSQQVEQQVVQAVYQQAQVTYEKYVRRLGDEESSYEVYEGYENLINIQPDSHGEGDQKKLIAELVATRGVDSMLYLRRLAGFHESRFNSFGYITLEAADRMLKDEAFRAKTKSGFVLHDLPDEYKVAITKGTRRKDAEENNIGEYPRLIITYKAGAKNANKTPLTPQIKKPIGPRIIKGDAEQFNVSKYEVDFGDFQHKHVNLSTLYFDEGAKTRIFQAIATQTDLAETIPLKASIVFDKSNKDAVCAQAILKRMGCYLTYLCHSDPYYIDVISSRKSAVSLDDIVENLKSTRDKLLRRNMCIRDKFYLLLRGEAKDCEVKEIAEKIIKQIENHPLLITTEEKSLHNALAVIEKQKPRSARLCLAQLLQINTMNVTDEVIAEALLGLFTEKFTEKVGEKPIPLLIECFAIIDWSKDEKLKVNFTNIFYKTFCTFVYKKINEFQIKLPSCEIDKNSVRQDQAKSLQEALSFVRVAMAMKEKEEKAKGFIESCASSVSSYFLGSVSEELKELENFIIDNGFLKENELDLALEAAPNNFLFANSWAVKKQKSLFKAAIIVKEKPSVECDLADESDYVFTSPSP